MIFINCLRLYNEIHVSTKPSSSMCQCSVREAYSWYSTVHVGNELNYDLTTLCKESMQYETLTPGPTQQGETGNSKKRKKASDKIEKMKGLIDDKTTGKE